MVVGTICEYDDRHYTTIDKEFYCLEDFNYNDPIDEQVNKYYSVDNECKRILK